ncbi:MAG: adenylosuccinate lyase [Candidatus Coatesbacteria bacterium]|nr:adenylosuccinate lyase [Candidatus Coatesbacteria bacterium]
MDRFHAVSPLDFRYYGAEKSIYDRLRPYVCEEASVLYQSRVEAMLVETFADLGLCSREVAEEVTKAAQSISAARVYELDEVLHHTSRAIVEAIREKVSEEGRRFIHLFATSFDILDTSNALRYQDLTRDVLIPDLASLISTLAGIAREHADTPQMGRTHGMHAEPITFGLFLSVYISRLGGRALNLELARQNLRGKLSGAVGAHNALALKFPRSSHLVEQLFLARLGLLPSETYTSTQVVEAEFMADYAHAVTSAFSVLANLADDMRHLHRSEIAEITEPRGKKGIGSSTMPHKTNPKSFENIKSLYKAFMPRMITQYLDQTSEHQRDLTNSSSGRFTMELATAFDYAIFRMQKTLKGLVIDKSKMQANLEAGKAFITAEPLYIMLSLCGVPDAYEKAKELASAAKERQLSILELARSDESLSEALDSLTPENLEILEDPSRYIGDAPIRVQATCEHWEARMSALIKDLDREKKVLSRIPARRFKELARRIADVEAGKLEPEQAIGILRNQMFEIS